MNLDPSSPSVDRTTFDVDDLYIYSPRSHAESSRRSEGQGTVGTLVARKIQNFSQLASLETLGIVFRHAGKLVRSAKQLPVEISAFLDRLVLAVLFRAASPTRKFSYVPFTRRVRSRPSLSPSPSVSPFPSLSHSLAHPLGLVFSLAIAFSLSGRSTHTRRNAACPSKRSFAAHADTHAHARVRWPRGCISMYFYARVIAPTVYFYLTRVICNEFSLSRSDRRAPPSAMLRGKKMGPFESRSSRGPVRNEATFASPLPASGPPSALPLMKRI